MYLDKSPVTGSTRFIIMKSCRLLLPNLVNDESQTQQLLFTIQGGRCLSPSPFADFRIIESLIRNSRQPLCGLVQQGEDGSLEVVGVFKRWGHFLTSALPIEALLIFAKTVDVGELEMNLGRLLTLTGAKAVYFPTVYANSESGRLLSLLASAHRWDRAPSMTIDWHDRGASLESRYRSSLGSQADRRILKWSRSLGVGTVCDSEVEHVIGKVDARSWKGEAGCDLTSTGQAKLFADLIRFGRAKMAATFLDNVPVAYRIDAHCGTIVLCMEWAFSRDAAALSPGAFLLVRGLVTAWSSVDVEMIDLFGADDTLKSAIASGERDRVDFAWPPCAETNELRAERMSHDAQSAYVARNGIGLARRYGVVES